MGVKLEYQAIFRAILIFSRQIRHHLVVRRAFVAVVCLFVVLGGRNHRAELATLDRLVRLRVDEGARVDPGRCERELLGRG